MTHTNMMTHSMMSHNITMVKVPLSISSDELENDEEAQELLREAEEKKRRLLTTPKKKTRGSPRKTPRKTPSKVLLITVMTHDQSLLLLFYRIKLHRRNYPEPRLKVRGKRRKKFNFQFECRRGSRRAKVDFKPEVQTQSTKTKMKKRKRKNEKRN